MADEFVDKNFPSESLVPKNETGVLNFLKKYPDYNGKDVIIAILDSGVDPCAAGLKCTTNHETKIIERFDCTGCGDVDTSTKVTATNSTITGLSGRVLKLSNSMKNNNLNGNDYHVGLKCLYDLYPAKVRERIIADYKLKSWDEPQKQLLANISREIEEFETLNKNNLSNLPFTDKLIKEDMTCSMEFLNNFEKKFSDIKTTYDCVLYETIDGWTVVIDTTETGDLENGLSIKEYSKSHEIKSLDDCLSVSINVYNNGNVVEIVGMCSSHGTHVASITSGNHKESPELNGVAPGAKIISLTIGDGRLSSMETGTALVRAIIKIMELCNDGIKVDIINMSYGEHAHWSNSGRIGELMNEIVNKYGVVWVASAGNHGPALCTIGTPPDISQPSCIGVGAYVSPEMMVAEYALRQKLPANLYTWTSRDPCIDGGDGVTVCAPGAAIASVPAFTMSSAQLMNGTSMAAPHVAGAVGLLISGLKQRKIKYTPYSIKRAISNTATRLNNVDNFAQGSGLLNVEKAFENLLAYANAKENQVRFSVVVGTHSKGIHMRHGHLKKPEEFSVNIEPFFFNDKEIEPKEKINFNVRLTLVPTVSWVKCGTFLDLCYSARQISVKVDPTNLKAGVHTARVKAYDTLCIEKGTLFEIPITVIQPLIVPENCPSDSNARKIDFKESITCKPNTIIRNFIEVPKYATWAVLKIRSTASSDNTGGRFLIHTMQILPMNYCKALETQKILPVNSDLDTVHSFKCEENNILEVCIAKYWSNYGEIEIQYSIHFHGISSNLNHSMIAARGIHRIDLTAYSPEDIQPVLQLKTGVIVLKPVETKVTPLTKRDVIPNGRQIYQNVFTFNLHLTKPQDISISVPLFNNVLYESEYESQMWMLFDINKMMISCGDAYSNNSYFKIEKGDYVIKLQVRHERKELLEKINDLFILVNCKLTNPIVLDVYKTYNLAITGSKKLGSFSIKSGQTKPIYVTPVSNDKITKACLPSSNDKSSKTSNSLNDKYSKTNPSFSWMDGTITYMRDELGRKCDIHQFQYILNDGQLVKKPNDTSVKETKTKLEEYTEGLRDFQNTMIQKMDSEIADKIYKELIKEHPDYIQAHLSLIQNIDSADIKHHLPFTYEKNILKLTADNQSENLEKLKDILNKIISLTNLILDGIDKDALLSYYGLKSDSRTDASKIRSNMEKQKNLLLEAYTKKLIAIVKLNVFNQTSKDSGDKNNLEEVDTIFNEIGKYTDYTDSKVLLSIVWHSYCKKHYGRLLQAIQKLYDEKLQKDLLKELRLIISKQKYEHVDKMLNKMMVSTNPPNYRLF